MLAAFAAGVLVMGYARGRNRLVLYDGRSKGKPLVCPACGREAWTGTEICPRCGSRIEPDYAQGPTPGGFEVVVSARPEKEIPVAAVYRPLGASENDQKIH